MNELEKLIMEKLGCEKCYRFKVCFDDDYKVCDKFLEEEEKLKKQKDFANVEFRDEDIML